MKTAVAASHLTQTFTSRTGTVEAVKDVSFTVAPGEVVALLGENGAGKSTLLDMLLGLASPTAGSVKICGTAPAQAVRAPRVAAVLQSGGLLKDLTVKDQVAMVAATYPTAPKVWAALEAAGIADIANRKIAKCSGGQQQKVRFAIALLSDPEILVLDEPTTGMDVKARAAFWESMHAQATLGKTILFATHYLEEAQDFADRIIMLSHGSVVADATTEQIRAQAGVRTVRFRLDGGSELALTAQQQEEWGVQLSPAQKGRYTLSCVEVERFLAFVLAEYPLTQLEVTQPTLAEAFSILARTN
ncbi:ABC transporter ATP-binding protein [Rothia sp. CCM 9417]|uniref:ABC transporter ATP-binding protein n=1 Tax=Rothia sp. CCM 9417 TaxID=3402657 RepID=UPI003AEEBA8B